MIYDEVLDKLEQYILRAKSRSVINTMSLPSFLSYALGLASQFKYPLVFLGTIVEGPILMVASGFLIHTGLFDFAPLFFTLIAGDLVGDVLWYLVGYGFAEPLLKKHGHILSVTPESFEKAKMLFHRYHMSILFISKITLGFGMALGTLMAAGATHIRFRTYMIINLFGELILVGVLLALGYFFGNVYTSIARDFKIVFVIAISAVLLIAGYGFSRFIKRRILSS